MSGTSAIFESIQANNVPAVGACDKLELTDGKIGEDGGALLALGLAAVKDRSHLTEVLLKNHDLTDDGAIPILKALHEHMWPNLRILDLGGNCLTDDSALECAQVLATQVASLREVRLRVNEFKSAGKQALEKAALASALVVLQLDGGLSAAVAQHIEANNIKEKEVILRAKSASRLLDAQLSALRDILPAGEVVLARARRASLISAVQYAHAIPTTSLPSDLVQALQDVRDRIQALNAIESIHIEALQAATARGEASSGEQAAGALISACAALQEARRVEDLFVEPVANAKSAIGKFIEECDKQKTRLRGLVDLQFALLNDAANKVLAVIVETSALDKMDDALLTVAGAARRAAAFGQRLEAGVEEKNELVRRWAHAARQRETEQLAAIERALDASDVEGMQAATALAPATPRVQARIDGVRKQLQRLERARELQQQTVAADAGGSAEAAATSAAVSSADLQKALLLTQLIALLPTSHDDLRTSGIAELRPIVQLAARASVNELSSADAGMLAAVHERVERLRAAETLALSYMQPALAMAEKLAERESSGKPLTESQVLNAMTAVSGALQMAYTSPPPEHRKQFLSSTFQTTCDLLAARLQALQYRATHLQMKVNAAALEGRFDQVDGAAQTLQLKQDECASMLQQHAGGGGGGGAMTVVQDVHLNSGQIAALAEQIRASLEPEFVAMSNRIEFKIDEATGVLKQVGADVAHLADEARQAMNALQSAIGQITAQLQSLEQLARSQAGQAGSAVTNEFLVRALKDLETRMLQGCDEIKKRCMPSLCMLLPVLPDQQSFFQRLKSRAGFQYSTVHFLCEYQPATHCSTWYTADEAREWKERGFHFTQHAGFQIAQANETLLRIMSGCATVLTIARYASIVLRAIGVCVDGEIGKVAHELESACKTLMGNSEILERGSGTHAPRDDEYEREHAAAQASERLAANARLFAPRAADDEKHEVVAVSQAQEADTLPRTVASLQTSNAAAAASSATSRQTVMDGTDLVRLWHEIDPSKSWEAASADGVAQLHSTMVKEQDGMRIRFYCKEHHELVARADSELRDGESQRDFEHRVYVEKGLAISQRATAACRIAAVQLLRLNVLSQRTYQSQMQRCELLCVQFEKWKRKTDRAASDARQSVGDEKKTHDREHIDYSRKLQMAEQTLLQAYKDLVFTIDASDVKNVRGTDMPDEKRVSAETICAKGCGQEFGVMTCRHKCRFCGAVCCDACAPEVEYTGTKLCDGSAFSVTLRACRGGAAGVLDQYRTCHKRASEAKFLLASE